MNIRKIDNIEKFNEWRFKSTIDPSEKIEPISYPCILVYDWFYIQDMYGSSNELVYEIIYPEMFLAGTPIRA